MTTQEIFSKIQIAINDPKFAKVQRAEYLQYLEETLAQIAFDTGLYLNNFELDTQEGSNEVSIDLSTGEPLKIERVERNDYVCREYSVNAIKNAIVDSNNRGFSTNNTSLDIRAYGVILEPNYPPRMRLIFAEPFIRDEKVKVTVSSTIEKTNLPTTFSDPKFIPIYAVDTVYYGVLSKILQVLSGSYKDIKNDWIETDIMYIKKKKELKAYLKSLKSRSGVNVIQPILWLSDIDGDRITGSHGMPEEYWKSII